MIKQVAEHLYRGAFPETNMVLRQFQIPETTDDPESNYHHWLLTRLGSAQDNQLVELFEHLFPDQVMPQASQPTGQDLWFSKHYRLFASHVATHKKMVTEVKNALLEYGIDTFVAHQDIEPAKEWATEIEVALDTCNAAAAFLTEDFHASNWTDQEIGYCLHRKVVTIPVCLGQMPYGFMSRYQGLPCIGKTAIQIAKDIFEVLMTRDTTAQQLIPALVEKFVTSGSYMEARTNIGRLEAINSWTSELLDRIQASIAENSQVRDAFGVASRVMALVKKYRL